MKVIYFVVSSILFFFTTNVTGQISSGNAYPLLTIGQRDSIYQAVNLKNHLAYKDWKETLPIRKKQTIVKYTVLSSVFGMLLGVGVESVATTSCELVTFPTAIFTSEEPCPSKPIRAALIGGTVGMRVGLTLGITRSKRLKFKPKMYPNYIR